MIRSGKDELIEITISSPSFTPAKKTSPLTTYPGWICRQVGPTGPQSRLTGTACRPMVHACCWPQNTVVTTDMFHLVTCNPLSHSFWESMFKSGVFEAGPKVAVTCYCSPMFWDYRHVIPWCLLTLKKRNCNSIHYQNSNNKFCILLVKKTLNTDYGYF